MANNLRLKGSRKYPNVPIITDDPAVHTAALVALKESMEIGQRRTPDLFNSFVRVQDLLDLGLIDLKGNTQSVVGADLSQIANIGDLSGAALNDFLRYDGTDWVNDQLSNGDITQAMVTQHEAALSIDWSQITSIPALVLDSRTLTAGAGLTGGGDLSANRTFDVGAGTGITVNANDVALSAASIASLLLADTSVQPARTLTAGAGLTGGGTLAADRTFDVGAGTGITVNANDVAVNQATNFTWTGIHNWQSVDGVSPDVSGEYLDGDATLHALRLTLNTPGHMPMINIKNLDTTVGSTRAITGFYLENTNGAGGWYNSSFHAYGENYNVAGYRGYGLLTNDVGRGIAIRAGDPGNLGNIRFLTTQAGVSNDRWTITPFGDYKPAADNTYSIGDASLRLAELYAVTLKFSTGIMDAATVASILFSLRVAGSQKAAFALSGAIEGDSSTDLSLFAEAGNGIRFYVDGSATEVGTWGTTGLILAQANPSLQLNSTLPQIRFQETDASTDQGRWEMFANGGVFTARLLNDARSTVAKILDVTRSGTGASVVVDAFKLYAGASVEVLRVDATATAGDTRLMIYDVDNATLERVTVGAADSGGTGFKVLRIPN